jgi:hypothetical protein
VSPNEAGQQSDDAGQWLPVDAFWSIIVYNDQGYLESNPYNSYSLNNITANKSTDGSVAVQFGMGGGGLRGRPIHDYDLDAIQKCVQLSKDHEKKYKEAIEQTFRMWKSKAEKDFRDGTYTSKVDAENAIDAKIDELKGRLQAACLDLHSKEGIIEVTFIKGQPKANVVMKAAGNTGCGPATPAMVRLARHGRRSPSVIVLGG